MVNYSFSKDLLMFRTLKGLTQESLSNATGISRVTIARAENESRVPLRQTLESFYSFVSMNDFKLNEVKANLLIDNKKDSIVLFHGAKEEIVENINTKHSDDINDFGKAFYAGETYEQASTWVFDKKDSSVYAFYFDNNSNLKSIEFGVDEDWMIAILYYRRRIEKYKNSKKVKEVLLKIKDKDLIIAPIADNMMYDVLNKFASGLITNEQCLHALAANNLGKQYVFLNDNACKNLKPMDRYYLSTPERIKLGNIKKDNSTLGMQKTEAALHEYRRKGKFIDEFFGD